MYDEESTPQEPAGGGLVAGRYRLLSRLGEGGMGTVWRARDEMLQRDVAVKEVRGPAGLEPADMDRLYTRLQREAWAAARIADRNVVTVHDVVMESGRPWIVMELIRGRSLADLLRSAGPLTPQHAAYVGGEVLAGLRAAHAAGVEHRDVKPANVLIADDGRVVLTDFGIAVVEGTTALTMAGEVVGSPEYLPPERALGGTSGPESDLWSLGVLLYTAVEGASPFRQGTALGTLRAVVETEPPPPVRAGPLAAVVEGLLRKDPAERTPAGEAAAALRSIGGGGGAGAAFALAATGGGPAPDPGPESETVDAPALGAEAGRRPGGDTSRTAAMGSVPAGEDPAGARRAPAALAAAPLVPRRRRRAGTVVVAGVAVLAVLLGASGYALAQREEGAGRGADQVPAAASSPGAVRTPGTVRTPQGAGTPDPAGAPDGDRTPDTAGTPEAGRTPEATGRPDAGRTPDAVSVRVVVSGSGTTYRGACPPSGDRAPTFRATFTSSAPARISYRWVSDDGSVVDPHWRVMDLGGAGATAGQDTVSLTARARSGTLTGRIGVEIREPVSTASNQVPFTVTCLS
ncbi:serine/threonine-protein kinase [Streptomyces sp. NPDC085612]|uniref:serine/threonine-protein kinase n=1 Tax=Streptomyces sp. NPDC085612 TaxID=3365732 RepID=UPI0037D77514